MEAALSDLNQAIELLMPGLAARARLHRAAVFLALKGYDKAVLDLDESQRVDPGNPDLYFVRGMLEHDDAALEAYDEFSKRAPTKVTGLIRRAVTLEAMGRPSEALLAYENALNLEPTNSQASASSERLRSASSH
jgi:tetratricopeptide (TPR) repeat protein